MRATVLRAQHGFTLLEAIVALVLISSVGLATFGWINGNISALNRVQDANARSAATANILEYMRTVNPTLTPAGRATLGDLAIQWQSRPVTAVVDKTTSDYQLALYDTQVRVSGAEGRAWFDLELRQVGFKKVRFRNSVE